MRSDNQHLSFKTDTLSLGGLVSGVEVGSICADKLGHVVDYLRSLGPEELIYISVGLNVHGIGDDIPYTHPAEIVTRLVLYPVGAQVLDDIGEGHLWL